MCLFNLKTSIKHFVAAGTVDQNKPVCYTSVLNAEDKEDRKSHNPTYRVNVQYFIVRRYKTVEEPKGNSLG